MRQILAAATALSPLLFVSPAMADTLPLKRVVLSTSGLAHFEHEGQVAGSVTIELPVRLDQVDDLLKSLVVFDSGGRLGGVSVPGKAPLEEAFRDLPFTQADLNDPVQLLNALQGAEVLVTGANQTRGRLVRVVPFTVQLPNGQGSVTRHRLTLMTSQGMQTIELEGLDSVQFTEPEVQAQIDRALRALHENRVKDQRTLSINLQGEGAPRDVALAYVVSAPLWKAAYRLVLPAREETAGTIQGWAVIENRTGNDWRDVSLALTSGNPVTFRQPLYESYYVARPILPVEVLGRVIPRVDSGAIGGVDDVEGESPELAASMVPPPAPGALAMAPMAAMEADAYAPAKRERRMAMQMAAEPMDLAMGGGMAFNTQMVAGAQAAQSSEATTQVSFSFPGSFTVASGNSLMVPFVSESLPMEQVALYQPDSHPTHPFAAVSIENKSASGLPPGILTIYSSGSEGGTFVGDAQVPVLPKGESRFISFALDSKTQIDRQSSGDSQVVSAAIVDGTLRQRIKRADITTYAVKAPAEEDRVVVLEHPRMEGWDLVEPGRDGVTVTKSHYRIRVPVKGGETKRVVVRQERIDQEVVGLTGFSVEDFVYQANNAGRLDPRLREAFTRMAELRREVERIRQELTRLEETREALEDDQERLRSNLGAVPSNSDLGRRYLDRLSKQEDQVVMLDEQEEAARDRLEAAENELNAFIGQLKL